jgi:hypothetical protein
MAGIGQHVFLLYLLCPLHRWLKRKKENGPVMKEMQEIKQIRVPFSPVAIEPGSGRAQWSWRSSE